MNRPVHLAIAGHHSVGKSTYLRRLWERYGISNKSSHQHLSLQQEMALEALDAPTREYLDALQRHWTEKKWRPTEDATELRMGLRIGSGSPLEVLSLDLPGEWIEQSPASNPENSRPRQVLRQLGASDALLLFLEPADFYRTDILTAMRARLSDLRAQAKDTNGARRQLCRRMAAGLHASSTAQHEQSALLKALAMLRQNQPEPDAWYLRHLEDWIWDRDVLGWLHQITPLNWEGITLAVTAEWKDWPQARLTTNAGPIGLFAALREQMTIDAPDEDIVRRFRSMLDLWSLRHVSRALQLVFDQMDDHEERLVVALVVLKADQLPGFAGRGKPFTQLFPESLAHLKLKPGPDGFSQLIDASLAHYAGDTDWQNVMRDFAETLHESLLNLHAKTLDYQAFFVSSLGAADANEPVGLAQPWIWCARRVQRLRRLDRWHNWQARLGWSAAASWGAFIIAVTLDSIFG